MRVLLTGASGLLGSHILKQGLELGHTFKVISRKVNRRSYINKCLAQIELINCDLTDESSYPDNLMEGVDLFINSAALASPFKKDHQKMRAININAPQKLFTLAQENSLPLAVQISSVATLSSGQDDLTVDEKDIGNFRSTYYAHLKHDFDTWASKNIKTPLTTLHPCYMLGPWDSRPSSGSIFFALKMKRMPYFLNHQKNFVAAEDVARGVWQAIDQKAQGHYVLGGINSSISNFLNITAQHLKFDLQLIKFITPQDLTQMGIAPEKIAIIEEFCLSNAVSSKKAQETFNYQPQKDLSTMVKETIAYFSEFKMLRL